VLLIAPVVLYPLLLTVPVMADLARTGGPGATLGRVAVGFYGVLAALAVPLAWGFRVVGSGRVRWPALAGGALFTAACLSGFLQGFVLFLSLPLELGAPFGGLTVVGGVVAVGFWLFLLHLVVIGGWLLTQALDDLLERRAGRQAFGGQGNGSGRPGGRPGPGGRSGTPGRSGSSGGSTGGSGVGPGPGSGAGGSGVGSV
jgi:membrane protein